MGGSEEKPYSVPLPSVTHNGFLYKTPSMAKPVGERKGQEGTWGPMGQGNRGAGGVGGLRASPKRGAAGGIAPFPAPQGTAKAAGRCSITRPAWLE